MKRTMLQSTTLFAAAALLTACASGGQQEHTNDTAANGPQDTETRAQLAVFQQLFEQGGTGADTATRCVGLGSVPNLQAPSDALLTSLQQHSSAPVVAASRCGAGERASYNGQPAVFYGVEITECPTSGSCMARGGYYSGNLGSQTNLYRVEQINGEWQASVAQLGPAS